MNNNRIGDNNMIEVKDTLDEHKRMIVKNSDDLADIKKLLVCHVEEENSQFKELSENIAPVIDLMEDIAAVGRFGGRIKRFGIWLAGILAALGIIGTAIAGGWDWLQHFRIKH